MSEKNDEKKKLKREKRKPKKLRRLKRLKRLKLKRKLWRSEYIRFHLAERGLLL